nr:MAG: hypothetical protein 1 [Leviviridae sp.]
MSPRSRTFSRTVPKGTMTRFGTTWGVGGTVMVDKSTCTDHTGIGDSDPFGVYSYEMSGGRINNGYYSWFGGHFVNYVADCMDTDANFPHLDVTNVGPSNVEAATIAAARTSPSAPYVDVLANALEIADIAQLIKSTGETLIQKIARNNLRLQFGILPIVRDLDKLMNFQDQAMRRVAVIQKLRDTGSYRKTVKIGHYESYANDSIVAQSADAFIHVPRRISQSYNVGAHCRWIPSVDLSHMKRDQMRALAEEAIVNYRVNLSALWEAMPWSWLIDWCGNIGLFLKANGNTVPATLSGVFVTRHTRTEHVTDGFSDPSSGNRTMEPIRVIRETKLRQPSFVAPAARWPFLSANQLGILASLLVK